MARRRSLIRADLQDQHPEVQRIIGPVLEQEDREDDLLKSIGIVIGEKRDDAREARQSSGIEEVWRACEEHYVGIDDANRLEFQSARWAKPMVPSGPVSTNRSPSSSGSNRSSLYLRLTARYVDAGYAKLSEILLPPDEKAFSFTETPVPELIESRNDKTQIRSDSGEPLTRPAYPGEIPPPPQGPAPDSPPGAQLPAAGATPASSPAGAVAQGPQAAAPPSSPQQLPPPPQARVPLTVSDLAEEKIALARKKAKAAEKRIYDWMVETCYRAESRKVLFDSARLGVGILKGPFPMIKRQAVASRRGGKVKVLLEERVIPGSQWVSPWDFFPDSSCGENIHDGDHCFERDWMSEKQLRDLRGQPGYIDDQIDLVIEQGPDKTKQRARENGDLYAEKKPRYEVWYFYGHLKEYELSCVCRSAGQPPIRDARDEPVPVIATLVNDVCIKAVPAPLDSGRFPYRTMPWTRRAGHWAGIGIGEQVSAPQRMLNGAVRAMMNNAGKSAGSQIVIDQTAIRPADNKWEIVPDKIWYKTAESIAQDVRAVFELYKIPNVTNELLQIVKLALQMAEENTSIPLISQGQTGPDTPETVGAAQIQNSNANQLLRSIGYSYDDHVTEPHVRDHYEWLLLDPDVPDDEKGDFQIDAHGSVAMVERAIQDATIAQMGQLVVNPIYGINPKKWATQLIMSKHLNPDDFKYSPEEQAKIDSTPPADPPQVAAAKVTMQGWQAEAQIKAQADMHKVDQDHQTRMEELKVKERIAMLDYATQHKSTLVQVQAELAQTTMKLRTEAQLNEQNNVHENVRHDKKLTNDRIMKPPVQLPGRSANGKAFSQSRPRGSR